MGELASKIEILQDRLHKVKSQGEVAKTSNILLAERVHQLDSTIISLERGVLTNAQYARNRQVELHHVPLDIADSELASTMCDFMCLTGKSVNTDQLAKCHRLKRKSSVIIEFNNRKDRDDIIFSKKNLKFKKARDVEHGCSWQYHPY